MQHLFFYSTACVNWLVGSIINHLVDRINPAVRFLKWNKKSQKNIQILLSVITKSDARINGVVNIIFRCANLISSICSSFSCCLN